MCFSKPFKYRKNIMKIKLPLHLSHKWRELLLSHTTQNFIVKKARKGEEGSKKGKE